MSLSPLRTVSPSATQTLLTVWLEERNTFCILSVVTMPLVVEVSPQ